MPIRKDDEVVVTRGHYKGQPAAKVTAVRRRERESAVFKDTKCLFEFFFSAGVQEEVGGAH